MPKLPEGVTQRAAGYWGDQGYVTPIGGNPGRGHPRRYSPENWRKLTAMGLLRQLGFDLDQSAEIAESLMNADMSDNNNVQVERGHGVTIFINPAVFFEGMDENGGN